MGAEIDCVSVRLVPPVLSLNLLSWDCWQAQAANRKERQEQVAQLAQYLGAGPSESLAVVGGDFNAPQGDGSLAPLRHRFRDSFAEGGGGWGNTVTNDFPVLRFDQVWISSGLRAVAVSAHKTQHSDHRMVICDLVIEEGEGE
jgi:endonuclease/exonuclease/phosphatase family metal-dependent hydrolase